MQHNFNSMEKEKMMDYIKQKHELDSRIGTLRNDIKSMSGLTSPISKVENCYITGQKVGSLAN